MLYLYFSFTIVLTLALCVLAYRFFNNKIKDLEVKLDDGRGYFLVSVILITFLCSSIAYFVGTWLGFDTTIDLQSRLVAAVLFNAVVALLSLIYGLVQFKEGDKY